MADGGKGLNPDYAAGLSHNRYKFQNKRTRARGVDVDVTHKLRTEGYLDADSSTLPEAGDGGCFFQDELERAKELNTTSAFKRFYYAVWPLVQSLAELLHHSEAVVGMLLALLQDPAASALCGDQLLQLLTVLARDLQGGFHPHFAASMQALTGLLQGSSGDEPETAGRILRAVGHLLKFDVRELLQDPDAVRPYYAALLGHRRDYVRRFAAETFSALLRKLKPKPLRRHVRQLLVALGSACQAQEGDSGAAASVAKRREDILDGCCRLLFCALKGVAGRTHSRGPALLRVILESMLVKSEDESSSSTSGNSSSSTDDAEARRWCFELATRTVALLVGHLRSPYSEEVWLELQFALGAATERHAAACNSSSSSGSSNDTAATDAALLCQVKLITQAVAHYRGALLREPAIAQAQAPLLARALEALTAPSLFAAAGTSGATREATLRLAGAALRCLHQHARLTRCVPTLVAAVAAGGASDNSSTSSSSSSHPALALCEALLVGAPEAVAAVALPPLLTACAGPLLQQGSGLVLEVLLRAVAATHCRLEPISGGTGTAADDSDDEEQEETSPELSSELLMVTRPLPLDTAAGARLLQVCCDCCTEAAAAAVAVASAGSVDADGDSSDDENAADSETAVQQALAALRCMPLLIGSLPAALDKGPGATALKSALTAVNAVLSITTTATTAAGAAAATQLLILQSLAVESGVALVLLAPPSTASSKQLESWCSAAVSRLHAQPTSIAALRAATALLSAVRVRCSAAATAKLLGPAAAARTLPLLPANLLSQSKLLRLHSARLAASFEPLPFVTLSAAAGAAEVSAQHEGPCGLLQLLAAVEAAPLSLTSERAITAQLSRAEVMARSGALPPVYCALLASHCVGLLSAKYAAVWPAATAAFCAVSSAAAGSAAVEAAWQALLCKLHEVNPPPQRAVQSAAGSRRRQQQQQRQQGVVVSAAGDDAGSEAADAEQESDNEEEDTDAAIAAVSADSSSAVENGDAAADEAHTATTAVIAADSDASSELLLQSFWQTALTLEAAATVTVGCSTGSSTALDTAHPLSLQGVADDATVRLGLSPESGTVPLLSATDHDALHGLVWGVVGAAPGLLQRRSKLLVSMIISFVVRQYMAVHSDDPDVGAVAALMQREGGLEGEAGEAWPPGAAPTSGSVRGRLLTLLKLLGGCSAPRSLHRAPQLAALHTALLLRPDAPVARGALVALLAARPPGVAPYREPLLNMLDDNKLRNELTRFRLGEASSDSAAAEGSTGDSSSSGVQPEHRAKLFIAKGVKVGGRSSPPAARRAAILSFLAALRPSELGEFVALMVRAFLPSSVALSLEGGAAAALAAVQHTTAAAAGAVAMGRRVGFLNLVGDVTRQLGHKALPFVAPLLHLLLVLLEHAEQQAEAGAAASEAALALQQQNAGV
jgi:Down-regulated in metastasis